MLPILSISTILSEHYLWSLSHRLELQVFSMECFDADKDFTFLPLMGMGTVVCVMLGDGDNVEVIAGIRVGSKLWRWSGDR